MYLLIMTVLFLLAFAGVLVLLYLRKQDGLELEATDAVLTMATASLTRSVDYNEQLFAQLISAEADFANRSRGYEMDLEGMGRQQRTLGGLLDASYRRNEAQAATIRNMAQSIEVLSDEIDQRNILVAKLMLGADIVDQRDHRTLLDINENQD
jgi:hypothetical protein